MIPPETVTEIRRLFFAEHWKIGTIATELGLHHETVQAALETDRFNRPRQLRSSPVIDPYREFIQQTLEQYPRLRATRIYQMIRARGYQGGVSNLRRVVAGMRPQARKRFWR
jgi:transposase